MSQLLPSFLKPQSMRVPTCLLQVLPLVLAVIFLPAQAAADPAEQWRDLSGWLKGGWSFKLGDLTGRRTYREAAGGHALAWCESFDGRDLTGEGYLTFRDTARGARLFEMSVHNRENASDTMVGLPDSDFSSIRYKSSTDEGGGAPVQIVWQRTSRDSFRYDAFSAGDDTRELLWSAEFQRSGGAVECSGE